MTCDPHDALPYGQAGWVEGEVAIAEQVIESRWWQMVDAWFDANGIAIVWMSANELNVNGHPRYRRQVRRQWLRACGYAHGTLRDRYLAQPNGSRLSCGA